MKYYNVFLELADKTSGITELPAGEGAPLRLAEAKKQKAYFDQAIAKAVNPPFLSARIVKSAMRGDKSQIDPDNYWDVNRQS